MSRFDPADPVLECRLCPKGCVLAPGKRGDCRVRYNAGGGMLKTMVYGNPCSLHIDPVEKKPLFHFLPGSETFSLATAGCNLHCLYCQNWQISQADPEDLRTYPLPPRDLVATARARGCPSISYTYTDPVIFYEYCFDSAVLAREAGLSNVLVTAGYINEEPLRELLPYIDAANVDIKGFDEGFYRKVTTGELKPVLRAVELMVSAGVEVEITNLVVPTLNDTPRMIADLCRWVARVPGPQTPLHFSRFWPTHKLSGLPPTPEATLLEAATIARDAGLLHVYLGNLPGGGHQDTLCPSCKKALIKRRGYTIVEYHLEGNRCPACGAEVTGRFWPPGQRPPQTDEE